MVEAAGVELSSVLRRRKLLILRTATTAKKAPLPDPLYVYCTKMLLASEPLAVIQRAPSIPQMQSKCRDSFVCWPLTDRLAYTCSMMADFARLLARICSTVNSPPQTLQRQPGDAAGATIDPGC